MLTFGTREGQLISWSHGHCCNRNAHAHSRLHPYCFFLRSFIFALLQSIAANAHLNSMFKHFIYFAIGFKLLDKAEMAPLQVLIDKMFENDTAKWTIFLQSKYLAFQNFDSIRRIWCSRSKWMEINCVSFGLFTSSMKKCETLYSQNTSKVYRQHSIWHLFSKQSFLVQRFKLLLKTTDQRNFISILAACRRGLMKKERLCGYLTNWGVCNRKCWIEKQHIYYSILRFKYFLPKGLVPMSLFFFKLVCQTVKLWLQNQQWRGRLFLSLLPFRSTFKLIH